MKINCFSEKPIDSLESSLKFIVSNLKKNLQSWNSFISENPQISFDKLNYTQIVHSTLTDNRILTDTDTDTDYTDTDIGYI